MPPQDAAPVTKYIHVSPSTIRENYTAVQDGRLSAIRPAIVVKLPTAKINAYQVNILGPSRIVQNDRQQMDGARVWIETEAEIDIFTTRQDGA